MRGATDDAREGAPMDSQEFNKMLICRDCEMFAARVSD